MDSFPGPTAETCWMFSGRIFLNCNPQQVLPKFCQEGDFPNGVSPSVLQRSMLGLHHWFLDAHAF